MHLADRPQEATLAVQPKREQEVLYVLFKWVNGQYSTYLLTFTKKRGKHSWSERHIYFEAHAKK